VRNVLVALMLLLAPLQEPPTTTRVSPFNWPAGTAALVDTEYVRELSDGIAVRQVAVLHMTHRMRVSRHPEGLLVEFDNQKPIEAAGDMTDAFGALLSWWIPRIVVSADGRLLRIEQIERVQELVGQMYGPLAAMPSAQSPAALNDFLTIMASGTGLRSMAQADWDHLVGKWIAAPLDGNVVEATAASTVAPGVEVRSKVQQRMIDRASCTREDAALECATVELRSTVEPESLAVLQNYLSPAGGGMRIVSSDAVDRVILETGTMLPHEATLTRTIESLIAPNGRLTNLQRRQVRFTYVKPQ
jgi:hypothetical protein